MRELRARACGRLGPALVATYVLAVLLVPLAHQDSARPHSPTHCAACGLTSIAAAPPGNASAVVEFHAPPGWLTRARAERLPDSIALARTTGRSPPALSA
jgi:hypothetical protein